jgi:hypothetical protein
VGAINKDRETEVKDEQKKREWLQELLQAFVNAMR